ncbi:Uncharacterised protein [uncultured archaeon]|nr:Uncharacterised protein [uncultured archaeon]
MEEERKESENMVESHHKKINLTEKMRENPWMPATIVSGILILVLLFSVFSGALTGNAVSSKTAGEKLLAFYQSMGVENLTLDSVSEISGLYQVNVNYNNKLISLYITKDGKNVVPSLTPIEIASSDSSTAQTEVPKADKPKVELYVFTYCPYGLQMEKAAIPAVELFGDKIDFSIRYIGDMHSPKGCSGSACFEKTETERQLCIEKNYPDKYLDYVSAFASDTAIGACSGDASCLAPKLIALYSKLGIDSSKIDSCIASDGETMYEAEVSNSQKINSQITAINPKGGLGSPYLIINGQVEEQQPSRRSPEEIKGAVCSAFNNVPSECSTSLSTTSASAGFGAGTSSSSSTASC